MVHQDWVNSHWAETARHDWVLRIALRLLRIVDGYLRKVVRIEADHWVGGHLHRASTDDVYGCCVQIPLTLRLGHYRSGNDPCGCELLLVE